jgi:hypothetical protein
LKSNTVVVRWERNVVFKSTKEKELFGFTVTGPRKNYKFKIRYKGQFKMNIGIKYLEFEFKPYSTYIGLNEEILTLKFPNPHYIVSETDNSLEVANKETSITISERSDAIPESTDLIARIISIVVGMGTLLTIWMTYLLKYLLGIKFNLGWGLINFIQIVAFIPLADFYFPGNVRSYVSILKYANTAGQGVHNVFYLFIDRGELETKPHNYRFETMGFKSNIFIENCGCQITILIVMATLWLVFDMIKWVMMRYRYENKYISKPLGWISGIINYQAWAKMIIVVYMFLYLSSLLTTWEFIFKNNHEAASWSIASLCFLLSISFIFYVFYKIQEFNKKIEDLDFRKKIACIIQDIDVNGRIFCRFYIPIYLTRRLVFMSIIYAFDNFYLLLAHCIVMLIIVIILHPYEIKWMNYTLVFNEVMITIIMGISGIFVKKDLNNDTALKWGWVWIALATLTIVCNWVMYIWIQIVISRQEKKKKISSDEAKRKENANNSKDKSHQSGNFNEDPHDFDDPNNGVPKTINFNRVDQYDSQNTMISPSKKNGKDEGILKITNVYEDELHEEEKVSHMNTLSPYDKYNNMRKTSRDIDEEFGYAYSPSKDTSASPNKIMNHYESNKGIYSDSGASAIKVRYMDYDEVKPRKFSYGSELDSPGSEANLNSAEKIASTKNILVREMPLYKPGEAIQMRSNSGK